MSFRMKVALAAVVGVSAVSVGVGLASQPPEEQVGRSIEDVGTFVVETQTGKTPQQQFGSVIEQVGRAAKP